MTEQELFDQCMKEAQELCYGCFSPELDNLARQDVESIYMKVLIEWDLVQENQPQFDEATEEEKREWSRKAEKFIDKWRVIVRELRTGSI